MIWQGSGKLRNITTEVKKLHHKDNILTASVSGLHSEMTAS